MLFRLPKDTTELPFTVGALLDWKSFELVLDLDHADASLPRGHRPQIEAPAGLALDRGPAEGFPEFQPTAMSADHVAKWLPELGPDSPSTQVKLVPFPLGLPGELDMWAVDVAIPAPAAVYSPVVRLAPARYQEHSLGGCHMSKLAYADFALLLPEPGPPPGPLSAPLPGGGS